VWRRLRPGRWRGRADFCPSPTLLAAQTFRKVFRLLDTQALQRGFAAWAASLRAEAREVIAVDGKTSREPKTSAGRKGALHLVSAYATEARLVLAQPAIDGKSNEIKAISKLLDMFNPKGGIVSISTPWTQKDRPAHRRQRRGHFLALKDNQTSLHDASLFFADPVCSAGCAASAETDAGRGRNEELSCRVAEASWLAERHPDWKGRVRSPPSPPGASTRGATAKASRPATSSQPDPEGNSRSRARQCRILP
jgi:hypothetical protein